MPRSRLRAGERKQAVGVQEEIAFGVLAVAREITPHFNRSELYWRAPFQFVVEQMAPRVCAAQGLPVEESDHVAAYLLAALNEYVVALVGEFDVEHFTAWIGAEGGRDG